MQNQYKTLKVLAAIVEDAKHPTQFAVTTREMILHSNFGWEEIFVHLNTLSKEGLVTIASAGTIQFCITEKGLAKAGDKRLALA